MIKGDYIVKSYIKGQLYPIPINLDTLEKFLKENLKVKVMQNLLIL